MFGLGTNDRLIACQVQAAADAQLIAKLWAENERLRARLAPFTTPRARDDKGRFIKDTVA